MEQILHTFAPVYDGASRVLILGTLPSPKSREQGFYYGHPRNRFWPVLAALFNRELPATVPEKKRLLLEEKIALWDMVSSCLIRGAADGSIRQAVTHDLGPIFAAADLRAVFTNGRKAAALYEKAAKTDAIAAVPYFSLPSTSPANCAFSFAALLKSYEAILPYINID